MLKTGDAAAAILRLGDGRFVMQLRDDRPDIWYPAHWGCFGGAVDPGETPEETIARELLEEIEFRPEMLTRVAQFDLGLDALGFTSCYRIYFLAEMTDAEFKRLVLHEGAAVEALPYERLMNELRVTPYDAFAIRLLRLSETGR